MKARQAKSKHFSSPAGFYSALVVLILLVPAGLFGQKTALLSGYALVEAGSFQMGDNDFDPEKPIHGVRLSRPFYIKAKEVTVAEFRNFVKATGYKTTAEVANGSWIWTGSQ